MQSKTPTAEAHPPAEAVPIDAPHWRRERCIDLHSGELAARLSARLGNPETPAGDSFAWLAAALQALVPATARSRWTDLYQSYQPFDADAEMPVDEVALHCDQSIATLFDRLDNVARAAAYERLSRAEIVEALKAASDWGINLHVDFEVFERLEVYARGDVIGRRTRRRWQSLYRHEEVDVPIFRRLAVAYRLRSAKRVQFHSDAPCVYLKLFKNVPKLDLEMLLPGTRVRMTFVDQGRILIPTLGGLALVLFKLIKGILLVAFAGVYGMLALLGLLGGTFGYGVRTFLGYMRTRDRYQLNLTNNLYYQNLGSNRLVLLELAEHACEQETCEALLAVAVMHTHPQGCTPDEIAAGARDWYGQLAGADIEFDSQAALRTLQRCELVAASGNDRWELRPLDAALNQLRHRAFDV